MAVFSGLALLSLVALNFFFVSKTFIDVPYRDSWQLIDSSFAEIFPLHWILTPHNEHLIALTKLQVWTLYKMTSWDVELHLWLNLLIFFSYLFLLICFLLRFIGAKNAAWILLPASLCLTDLNWENLSWEFQSSFHFFMLFSLLTVYFLFRAKLTIRTATLALVFNLLSLFSLSTGAASSVAILLVFIVSQYRKQKEFYFVVSGFVAAILAWLFTSLGASTIEGKVFPHQYQFWDFLLNLISFGFGFETYSASLGLVCLLFILIPVLLHFIKQKPSPESWGMLALLLSCIAALLLIAVGRAAKSDIHIWSKGGRYFEIASALVPISFAFWARLILSHFGEMALKKTAALFGLLLLPICGSLNNWNFSKYFWIAEQKKQGLQCLLESRKPGKKFTCAQIWGEEFSAKLAKSKELKLSFVRGRNA